MAFLMSEYNRYDASCAQHRNRKYIAQSAILLRPKRIKNKSAEKTSSYLQRRMKNPSAHFHLCVLIAL